MRYQTLRIFSIVAFLVLLGGWVHPEIALSDQIVRAEPIYQQSFPSFDGIGKRYMDREIAQVMGYQGASWLMRSRRQREEKPSLLPEALNLQPTDVVADIGAGTGYISFLIAPFVSQGKVLAVDVQPEMLRVLTFITQKRGIANVEPVLGTSVSPNLPEESVDLAMMVDAYHEFEYPREMMQGIVSALKPSGRVVLVEYRGEDPAIAIKPLHKMTQQQARQEMAAVGLSWIATKEILPKQHIMIFQKSP